MQNNLIQFFTCDHLPQHLKTVSKPFGDLARQLEVDLPANPEKTVAMRKLLEAKDCAVRAILFKADVTPQSAPADPNIGDTKAA
ncbi:hypothetical protein [Rhodopila sp.]|uniref:hypothetical protein n=1 Tax=Rhodopila sp. TaxID=2480087 RepID=UPI003D1449D5